MSIAPAPDETITRIDEVLKDAATGLDILEHLDFEPELECEHSNHGVKPWHTGPAAHLIAGRSPCGSCGAYVDKQIMLCASAWLHWFKSGVKCADCEQLRPRDELVVIVGSVK